ncbi:hypothetical protein H6F61_07900 [Cyanobacteria bacterium FACHB-472]|nr:hypothetical protein [Cyanobacteria bacterium FACHB-472]
MSDETIRVVTYETLSDSPQPTAPEGAKIGMDVGANFWADEVQPDEFKLQKVEQKTDKFRLHDVSVQKLEHGLAKFMNTVDQLFSHTEQQANMQFTQLDEVELSVEVNGEGQVSLLGSGTKVGGKSAITLKFKRRK